MKSKKKVIDRYFKENFSTNLTICLKMNKMTQQELANKLEMSISTVSVYCGGKRLPNEKVISNILGVFGITRAELFGETSELITTLEKKGLMYIEPEKFSRNLNECLRICDMTKNELAKKIGVSIGSVSFYCRGEKIPKKGTILKILDVFGLTEEELLGETSELINILAENSLRYIESKEFGRNLTICLRTYYMTSIDLAKRVGVSIPTVADYCKGNKIPRKEVLTRILGVFDITEEELLGETSELITTLEKKGLMYIEPEKFAKNLKVCLRSSKMTQSKLAELIGVSIPTVSEYCSGEIIPKKKVILKILDIFDITEEEFFAETSELITIFAKKGLMHVESKEFGRNLTILLKIYNVTQPELAKQIGVPICCVSEYCRGKGILNKRVISNILDVFGITEVELFGEKSELITTLERKGLRYIELEIFARNLTVCLRSSQMTRSKLAKQIGVPGVYVSEYCGAKRIPNREVILKISDVFDITEEELLGETSELITILAKKGLRDIEPEKLGRNLKVCLRSSKMTQNELAELIGVSISTVSEYCRGKRMPNEKVILKILGVFGITRAELFGETSELVKILKNK